MAEGYFEKFKDFLDSGTSEAKATKVALTVLAIAATPALVLIAASIGNAVQVFKQFETSKRLNERQIRDSIIYLRHKRFIEYVADKNGTTVVKITKKGETKLRAFAIDLMEIKKPKVWDKKWRLVMFDIPMRFTKGREALRFRLKQLGFYQFQKSAWIYPYPCEDEILFVANFCKVEKYVEILTVDDILRDSKLRKYFQLEKYS